ncbi:MAG: hypothetical protein WCB01_01235, partial [Candidatus Cybelea sp.]
MTDAAHDDTVPRAFAHRAWTARDFGTLNAGAQARFDATEAGEDFEYGTKPFRRLSRQEITEICTGG